MSGPVVKIDTGVESAGVAVRPIPARPTSVEDSAVLPTQRGGPRSSVLSAEILLVDPDPATRESLRRTLSSVGIARLTPAGSFEAVQDVLASGLIGDLALVSLALGAQAPATVAALRTAGWTRTVALSPTADIGPVMDAVGAGVSGVLIGRRANPAARSLPSSIHDLSSREIEVIRLVADGRSNKWIGEQLSLSSLTVKSHLARIGRKLGTGDRAHMVALALRAGVIG